MFSVSLAVAALAVGGAAQYVGLFSYPDACGYFQYPNATLDANDLPRVIENALREVDVLLERTTYDTGMPGVSFGLVYDQELIHYAGVGVTNYDTQAKPNVDTIYRIGSVTKAFTVQMAMAMRDEGLLSLDDAIAKFNSKFSINDPWGISDDEKKGGGITLKQLTSELSGLPREAPCPWANEESAWCQENTTEILEKLANYDLNHPSDVQGSYSNLGYSLLGHLPSEYYGSDYETDLEEYILKPLGMSSSGMYISDSLKASRAATGYYGTEEQPWIDLGWAAPAGQMYSSVRDMAKWLSQFLGAFPGRYETEIAEETADSLKFSPSSLREQLRPHEIMPDLRTGFGAPWEIQKLDQYLVRSKGGNINGFTSSVALVPELKLAAVAFVNDGEDGSLWTLGPLQILIPAFRGYLLGQDAHFQPDYPKNPYLYTGTYLWDGDSAFDVDLVEESDGNYWLKAVASGLDYYVPYRLVFIRTDGKVDIFAALSTATDSETCWDRSASAMDGMHLHFKRNNNGEVVKATTIDYWGVNFERVDGAERQRAKEKAAAAAKAEASSKKKTTKKRRNGPFSFSGRKML